MRDANVEPNILTFTLSHWMMHEAATRLYIWPHLCPPRGYWSNGDHTPFPSYINPTSPPLLSSSSTITSSSSSSSHNLNKHISPPYLSLSLMASKALSSFSAKPGVSLLPHGVTSSPSVMSIGFPRHNTGGRGVVVASSTVDTNNMPMTGVVFQPFEEVKKADLAIPITSHASLARQRYADASEAAINEQIK